MNLRSIKRLSLLLLLGFAACKPNGSKIIMSGEKAEVDVKSVADCRNSTLLPLQNEAAIKANIQAYASGAIKKLKFKTNSDPEKSTCRISAIEYVFTELCSEKTENNPPPVKLRQKLTLENTVTKQIYTFETDTLINNQALTPTRLAVPKVDYDAYIQPLTEQNFKKAKGFFSKKK